MCDATSVRLEQDRSELYFLLSLLNKGELYSVNALFKSHCAHYLEIAKRLRDAAGGRPLVFTVDRDAQLVEVKGIGGFSTRFPLELSMGTLCPSKDGQLETPATVRTGKVCEFARTVYARHPKASDAKALEIQFSGKSDLFIEVRDAQTDLNSIMGFSIKSRFDSPSTLFNAENSSQLLFKLDGCNDDMIDALNAITENGKRGMYLAERGIGMEFIGTQNQTYAENLLLIRDRMAEILAWCVKECLFGFSENTNVKETIERMIERNPLNVPKPELYYEKAMKDLLMASFTGMTAGRPWDGREQVNGGYIVVMEDGDVLCYHSADREAFRDYLYRNTHFEYVRTKKYTRDYIRKVDGDYILPINVSIRFNQIVR